MKTQTQRIAEKGWRWAGGTRNGDVKVENGERWQSRRESVGGELVQVWIKLDRPKHDSLVVAWGKVVMDNGGASVPCAQKYVGKYNAHDDTISCENVVMSYTTPPRLEITSVKWRQVGPKPRGLGVTRVWKIVEWEYLK